VIDATCFHCFLIEFFASFLLFQPSLDLFLDQERLASCGRNQLGSVRLKLLLFILVVLLFELEFGSLHLEQLFFGEQLQPLDLDLIPDLPNIGLSRAVALVDHCFDFVCT